MIIINILINDYPFVWIVFVYQVYQLLVFLFDKLDSELDVFCAIICCIYLILNFKFI